MSDTPGFSQGVVRLQKLQKSYCVLLTPAGALDCLCLKPFVVDCPDESSFSGPDMAILMTSAVTEETDVAMYVSLTARRTTQCRPFEGKKHVGP